MEEISDFYQIGSWRDTLPAIAGNVTIRFHVPKHSGEAVFGTTFLPHQDKGLLQSFLIINFSEFQSLTSPPTSAPTVTPNGLCITLHFLFFFLTYYEIIIFYVHILLDDLIGPLGTMWIVIIVVGVVVVGKIFSSLFLLKFFVCLFFTFSFLFSDLFGNYIKVLVVLHF